MLFFWGLVIVWGLSALLSQFEFGLIHPVTGQAIEINNLLTGQSLAGFLSGMVKTFTGFAPLGIVLVAMLGVGVAEASGFINTGLKKMLNITPAKLLTPMLILVAIVSHTAADAGYVLVIPLGRHYFPCCRPPSSGGYCGGLCRCFRRLLGELYSFGIDPLLAGFTQSAAQILDPEYVVNPLSNLLFTGLSSIVVVAIGWYVTEKVIEPRLSKTPIDEDAEEAAGSGFVY